MESWSWILWFYSYRHKICDSQPLSGLWRSRVVDLASQRDLIDSEVTKWSHISDKIMASSFSMHYWDGMFCKGKWHLIPPDYRKVADYHARTYINDEDYWKLTLRELNVEKSPKTFSKKIYVRIHEWCDHRSLIQPPYIDGLLNLMMRYFHVKRH